MTTIAIHDLSPSGLDLFSDSESYMDELSEGDMKAVLGASPPTPVISLVAASIASIGFTASYAWGRYGKR